MNGEKLARDPGVSAGDGGPLGKREGDGKSLYGGVRSQDPLRNQPLGSQPSSALIDYAVSCRKALKAAKEALRYAVDPYETPEGGYEALFRAQALIEEVI